MRNKIEALVIYLLWAFGAFIFLAFFKDGFPDAVRNLFDYILNDMGLNTLLIIFYEVVSTALENALRLLVRVLLGVNYEDTLLPYFFAELRSKICEEAFPKLVLALPPWLFFLFKLVLAFLLLGCLACVGLVILDDKDSPEKGHESIFSPLTLNYFDRIERYLAAHEVQFLLWFWFLLLLIIEFIQVVKRKLRFSEEEVAAFLLVLYLIYRG